MGRASETVKRLEERGPLEPGQRRPIRPELKVRDDAPSIQIDGATTAEGTLEQMEAQPGNALALREANGNIRGVVLSPERYAELAGCEIEAEDRFHAFQGSVEPNPAALEELMIEQVDPSHEWRFGSRIWPPKH